MHCVLKRSIIIIKISLLDESFMIKEKRGKILQLLYFSLFLSNIRFYLDVGCLIYSQWEYLKSFSFNLVQPKVENSYLPRLLFVCCLYFILFHFTFAYFFSYYSSFFHNNHLRNWLNSLGCTFDIPILFRFLNISTRYDLWLPPRPM